MCKSHIHTQVQPDGRTKKWSENEYCNLSRRHDLCDQVQEFQHAPEYLHEPLSPSYGYGQFPPTPPRSSHSPSGSDRSSKRRSGVYLNGQKVLDINQKRSSRHERDERVVYIENPPMSRTPPRQYALPRSTPPSPNAELFDVYEPRRRERVVDDRERPTTAHLRPAIKVAVVDDRPRRGHSRHGSKTSSHDSHDSSEEERRLRRKAEEAASRADELEAQRKREKIARQNAEINRRPAVPTAPPVTSQARYRRGSVVYDRRDGLISQMDQLRIAEFENEQRRRERLEQKMKEKEEADLQQRLAARLSAPTMQRRATVGHSQRRPKVTYDEGVY